MTSLSNINNISYFEKKDFMILDTTTIRNLEIFSNIYDKTEKGSLIGIIDRTKTPMGSRLLKSWLKRPLINVGDITKRQDAVEFLYNEQLITKDVQEKLKDILDIQRILSRISNGVNCPKDLLGLKRCLDQVPNLKKILQGTNSQLDNLFKQDGLEDISRLIELSIDNDAPAHIRDGKFIKKGYSKELDDLKEISGNAKRYILDLEKKERDKTGIKSLKIRFNKVFGYFIEVTKANLHLVPDNYIRKQTQVNSERFITEELKQKEEQILNSSEKQIELEQELYEVIVKKILDKSKMIITTAEEIAFLDVIANLAFIAVDNDYVRPEIDDGFGLNMKDSRHPVIEQIEEDYISNDCFFDKELHMMIITGPNMSGKSSYMRQVALIAILAQIGSFVPAKEATIGIIDRIFTRIGAFDDISSGQSTFMVEMNETSHIVNSATKKSLIILDEIGRGTSTYDGISLAWAISEYIIKHIKAKTLFATHYHQLNRLAEVYRGIKNFNISVLEKDDGIVFLHKIEEGGTDRSYGIEVARLAGLPKELINSAKKVMSHLEVEDKVAERISRPLKKSVVNEKKVKKQIDEEIRQLSLDGF
jgi:DNA mismatch repair protein MutS